MATTESLDPSRLRAALTHSVRDHWGLFLFEGIVLLVLGALAILAPVIASVTATVLFGWLLLVSGIVGLITSIRARHAPGFIWSLLSALVGIAAGVLLLIRPITGTLALTAVLIAFLMAEGLVSIVYALEHRRALSGRWGWMLASGAIDIVLAVILFIGLPWSALWALGLLLGINLIFGGWALIMMALHARSELKSTSPRGASPPSGAAAIPH